ncbi:MAG TPA: carboxymuconolactone decarboxylase family protein [Actinophytocola sp.]|jgi:alkylhydroperoxidase family enzyme|nr:carboxymuconolactone decarboxylase family protein [Actinophytocola sp.]
MTSGTDGARVPPLAPEERDQRQAALVAQAGAELAVYTTLVRNTDVFADLLPLGQRLLELSTLEPRVRELLILRVAWRCRAAYVWSHHETIGRAAGVTDDDLATLAADAAADADADADDRDALRAVLLRAADELVADHRLGDPTWQELAGRYPTEQVIEICMLAGQYVMLAGVLNSLGVQLEQGYPAPDWAGS